MDLAHRRDILRNRYPRWVPRTLGALLEEAATRYPDRPFVITDDRTITYAETLTWARRLADGLAALGVRRGDRVGLVMANHLEFVPIKFAIAMAGATAVPFNYRYRHDEMAYVLWQSECDVLVTMSGHDDLDYLSILDAIAPGWDSGEQEAFPGLRKTVVLPVGERSREGILTLSDLAEIGDAHPGAADGAGVTPDDVSDIIYTSGTTGVPKGVVLTHDKVMRTAYASALTRAYEDGRRVLSSLPCYHSFGYIEGVLSVMYVGGAIIPLPAFDPLAYFAAIQNHRANDVLCVPTMAIALVEHPAKTSFDLSSLRAMLLGAAPSPPWLWNAVRTWLNIDELCTGYGMTEAGGSMTMTRPEDPPEYNLRTVGRPKMAGAAGLPGGELAEYRTVDRNGTELPAGTEGVLVSRGPTTMLGYWKDPEGTSAILRDGWLFSGDLGVVEPDGSVRLTGRVKELYKSGGELVMPKEIEDFLTRHPAISQAFVIGVPDRFWGEVGYAYVVPAPGTSLTEESVIALCKAHLANFKVPKHVRVLSAEELPKTPTGKVQKHRLATMAAASLGTMTQ